MSGCLIWRGSGAFRVPKVVPEVVEGVVEEVVEEAVEKVVDEALRGFGG
jgi:hypothetical protein